jgi:hypothetical protein
MNARNVLILSAAVVGGLIILGFLTNILNAIVPLTVVAVVAFMLGRMSTHTNLLQAGMNLASRATTKAEPTLKAAAKPVEAAPVQQAAPEASKKELPKTGKLPQTQRLDAAKLNITDFEVKSSDQVMADAKKLEDDLAKKNAEYDPAAALEERKKRLLGDKPDQQ